MIAPSRFITASIVAALGVCGATHAQTALFSNASAVAGSPALNPTNSTLSNVNAPATTQWSEVTGTAGAANALAGLSGQSLLPAGTYRFADDFTVPSATTWQIQQVLVYAYQPGAVIAPFGAVNLRVWNGVPGAPGSAVVWGNTTTNRLLSVQSEAIYRVFNSISQPAPATPDTTRLIWKLTLNAPSLNLGAGHYWLDWQISCIDPLGDAFAPTATVAGVRSPAGANALQLKPAVPPAVSAAWTPIVDPGKPFQVSDAAQDLPFILMGNAVAGCAADFNASGSVTIQDIFDFLTAWFGNLPSADFNHSGSRTVQDIFDFLTTWFNGC